MVTPDGLSLIIAMCTCRRHNSPRLRRFRTHTHTRARLTRRFFRFARTLMLAEKYRRHKAVKLVKASRVQISSVTCDDWRHPLYVSVTNTLRAASKPRSIQPQTPVRRTSKAGLPSRSTGKRPRCWARSRDFRFAPSYLVTVIRP